MVARRSIFKGSSALHKQVSFALHKRDLYIVATHSKKDDFYVSFKKNPVYEGQKRPTHRGHTLHEGMPREVDTLNSSYGVIGHDFDVSFEKEPCL